MNSSSTFVRSRGSWLSWRLLTIVLPVIALLPASGKSASAAGSTYSIIDLGTLGGVGSWQYDAVGSTAGDVNELGQVVGAAFTPGGAQHAFFFDGMIMRDLGTLGGAGSRALGINDHGDVVGAAETSDRYTHAFLYDGAMRDLGVLNGVTSLAADINNHGLVAGTVDTGTVDPLNHRIEHAFLWENGQMHDLGTLGGTQSHAEAVNDSGQIAGSADATSVGAYPHAFVYDGAMHDLGTLGGDRSYATDINRSAQVVGFARICVCEYPHAFLFDGVMRDLGTLGGPGSYAYGVNDRGQVVGAADIGLDELRHPIAHAFLWQAGAMTDLNSLIPAGSGWLLREATAINTAGQIVGSGRIQGETHAFLLSPAPTNPPSVITTADASAAGGAYTFGSWTNQDVLVNLRSSSVDGSGVRSLTYSAWGGQPVSRTVVNGDSVSLRVAVGGETTISYFATDTLGRSESLQTVTVKIDKAAPVLIKTPTVSLVTSSQIDTGSSIARVRVKIGWAATDTLTGVDQYQVQQSIQGSAFTDVIASTPLPDALIWLDQDVPSQFRVRARDKIGNWSSWRSGYVVRLTAYQESESGLVYSGSWTTVEAGGAYGGSVRYAGAAADQVTLSFTGRSVAWVAPKDRISGQAEVWVDGAFVKTVDLYSWNATPRMVVAIKGGLNPAVTHAITVRVLGTKKAGSGGTRVNLDAFVVLK